MLGHVTFGESDFARGAQPAATVGAFKFHLTIEVADIERFSTDPMRQAGAAGLAVRRARRQAARRAGLASTCSSTSSPGVKHMLYRLWFRDGVGHPLTMTGFKLVKNDAGFDSGRTRRRCSRACCRATSTRAATPTATLSRRDPRHPGARLRQAADDVPAGGPASAPSRRLISSA
jgi:hypothetical protein